MAAFKQFLAEFDFNANFADDIRHAHMHEFFQSLRELVNKGGVMTTDINKMMRYVAEAILHPEFDYEKFDWEQMPEKVRPVFLTALKKVSNNIDAFSKGLKNYFMRDDELSVVFKANAHTIMGDAINQDESKRWRRFGADRAQKELYINVMCGQQTVPTAEAFVRSIKTTVSSQTELTDEQRQNKYKFLMRGQFVRMDIMSRRAARVLSDYNQGDGGEDSAMEPAIQTAPETANQAPATAPQPSVTPPANQSTK